jgi:hypothetical protein
MSFLLLLAVAMAPHVAFGAINVKISDGTTLLTSAGGCVTSGTSCSSFTISAATVLSRGFDLSSDTTTTNNVTHNILTCTTPPCTRHFPSGQATAQSGDTFKIQDIASTNRARIEKINIPAGGTATTGADSVVFKGAKFFALAGGAGKTLTLIYETQSGDLSTITSSTGNYLATAKIKGQFRLDTTSPIDGNNGAIAATCNSGESNPCVKLQLQINALTLNGQGSSATAVVTAAVPCATNSTTSPCGTGGFWSPGLLSGDQFLANDSGSVGCGTTCAPVQKGTLTVKFSALNQVLTLQNSAGSGLAPDTEDGLVDLAEALGEPGINQWLASCSADQPFQVQGLSPFGLQGRNQDVANANFPAKFAGFEANLVPATGGFTMESVVDTLAESVLSPSVAEKNNFCIMALIFSPTTRPQLKDIAPFTLDWTDFVVGNGQSINSLLGTLAFSDCTACFRVEIDLLKDGVNAGKLKIYLGNGGPNNTTDHNGTTPPLDFFLDSAFRVDASGIDPSGTLPGVAPQPCCITFADAASNANYGKLSVRAVRVVLESNDDLAQDNHQVTNVKAVVDGISSSSQLFVVSDNYTPSCNWPPLDGLKMQVYNVTDPLDRHWVQTVVDTRIEECILRADIDVTQLEGSGKYEVEVSAFSGASDPNQEFVGGVPLAVPGILVLK